MRSILGCIVLLNKRHNPAGANTLLCGGFFEQVRHTCQMQAGMWANRSRVMPTRRLLNLRCERNTINRTFERMDLRDEAEGQLCTVVHDCILCGQSCSDR